MLIKIGFIVLFFAVTVFIGFYCRRHSTDVNGFLMGGRAVGPWLTAFAYGTSYFSAVIFIGYAGQFGWKYGIAATWIGIGNAVIGSFLAWKVLAKRTRVMSHYYDSATMPDYFGKRFDSKALKIAASVLVFIFLIPYTASLYNGLSRLFYMAFNIDYIWCVIAMAVLTAIYVIAGGYMATAINDFIQGIIMLVGIIAVVAAVLNSNGGFTEAINGLSQVAVEGSALKGGFTSFFGPDLLSLSFVVLLTSFGTWGLPQMVQKFYAIKDEKSISRGTVISTVFAIIVAGGCYFLGGFGRLYGDKIERAANGSPVYDSIIPSMLSGLSPVLIGLVVILVLSASMSTLSSLVLTSGSTLTLDFIEPLRKKPMKPKNQMLTIRILILFFIIISSVIAIVQVKFSIAFIAQMMGISWGALAGAFLAPYMYSLYWKKVSRLSVWASFAFGAGLMIFDMVMYFGGIKFDNGFLSTIFASPINAGVVAMLGGIIIVPIVSILFPDKKMCEKAGEVFKNIEL